MTKYQELVEDIKKTNQLYNALKTKVNDGFVKELANFLGCNPDVIIVEFESPNYFDSNDMIKWKFELVIQIISPDQTLSVPLKGFSLITLKKRALEDPLTISYEGAENGASMEKLSIAIFDKVKKEIDEGSWF